ncbi:hypothetical protein NL676_012936 [Syzygium grande]|nr:hypothetical protein NL676_012936 [Syzygium grande]
MIICAFRLPAKLGSGVLSMLGATWKANVTSDVAKVADGLVMSFAEEISKTTSCLSSTGDLEASHEHVENALLQVG